MSLELLHQRLTEASAICFQVQGPAALADAISRYRGRRLVLEDHPWLRDAAGYLPDESGHEIQLLADAGQPLPADIETAVTIGLGAVPETGSVLLGGRHPQALQLSLRPRCHIVVISSASAGLTIAEALDLTDREPTGLVSWITGPSRTADIEKVLVLGAQGAAELVVIVYQEEYTSVNTPSP